MRRAKVENAVTQPPCVYMYINNLVEVRSTKQGILDSHLQKRRSTHLDAYLYLEALFFFFCSGLKCFFSPFRIILNSYNFVFFSLQCTYLFQKVVYVYLPMRSLYSQLALGIPRIRPFTASLMVTILDYLRVRTYISLCLFQ